MADGRPVQALPAKRSKFSDTRGPPPDKDRYHREVYELDYIVPNSGRFSSHDDRDVWRGRRAAIGEVIQREGADVRGRGPPGQTTLRGYLDDSRRHRNPPYPSGRERESRKESRPRSRERFHREGRSRHHGGDWQREAGTSARELAQHDFERSRGRERRGFEKELRDEHRNGKDAKPIQGSPAEKEAVQQPPGSDHGWQKSGKGRQNGDQDPFSGSGKWGHDKFEEVKDSPPRDNDPLRLILRGY